jgi:Endonuclease/Exonuclease/phosphatase family
VGVATFNANNLLSRWSFQADQPQTATVIPTAGITGPTAARLEAAAATEVEPIPQPKLVDVTLPDGTALTGVLRTYPRQPCQRDPKARAWIAQGIKALNADVLYLLEVEDQDALDAFDRDDLQPLGAGYPYRVVVEGNDRRRIDVAICSRLLIVRISSWRFWPDPAGDPVFGRDLLQAEIEAPDGRRTAQAVAIRQILRRLRVTRRAIVCGDLNDHPDAPTLTALAEHGLAERASHGTDIPGPNRADVLPWTSSPPCPPDRVDPPPRLRSQRHLRLLRPDLDQPGPAGARPPCHVAAPR